jgi:hypothetical protein
MLQFFGLDDPQGKMYIVRLLHAAWSMSIVYLGYKIALRLGGITAAKMCGVLLAILFFIPFISVHNLVEFVCIPPLLYATWLLIKKEDAETARPFLFVGLLLSVAFSIRFQTALFIGGIGLTLIIQKKWRQTFLVGGGIVVGLVLIQATTDMIVWKQPFVEFREYVSYNLTHSNDYGHQQWYTYLLLISGIMIPPFSLFIIFGFLRSWKKHLLLFLPSFIFFVFHSSFPNKQERFILPVVPFIIILGCIGWCNYMATSGYWKTHLKAYRNCWIFFFILNTIPLIFVSGAYSHRNRVESMVYLSEKKDLKNVLIEQTNNDDYTRPPRFYLKNWKQNFFLTGTFTMDSLKASLSKFPLADHPNYVVFNQPENLQARVENLKKLYPGLVYEATIEPGFIDKVMHYLNKHNANFTSYVYRIE